MQIKSIDGFNASCEAKGILRDVNLFLVQDLDLQEGDFVMVHVGYAIERVREEDAKSTWALLDEILDEIEETQ